MTQQLKLRLMLLASLFGITTLWLATSTFIFLLACIFIACISVLALGILIAEGRQTCKELGIYQAHKFGNLFFAYPDVLYLLADRAEYQTFCLSMRFFFRLSFLFSGLFICGLIILFLTQDDMTIIRQ